MLEVRLLGTFEVRHGRKAISITSRPAQSLFAYLILSAGTSHRREKLAGMLWPDSLEETARDNLRHALWRIRKALPTKPTTEYILGDDLSITFNVSAEYWLDASALEKLSESTSTDDLMAVLSNYQGELLPGFYDEWVLLEREHLYSIFEHHMARLMSLLQDEKRWLDILDWGERWIKLGQKPEPAYRALMSAHAAKGDMSKVAATYERCVKSLKEFGIEPSEQTRALYERLKAGKEKLETGSVAPVKEVRKESPKTNLPVPITSFIGREREVEEVIKLLGKHRLVTLMGSGGVGKTRLAIEASNKLTSKFKDGVWWADLVGLNDPSLVPQEVAKVVDVREVPNRPLIETLVEQLQSKQILLVLDNCEHLITACAQLVDGLLSGSKNLKILATSRETLDILGETAWQVPSLSLPNDQEIISTKTLNKYESLRLFVERAGAIHPQFGLTEQNIKSIVQICRRLSGMPLAIELAAARVKIMSVEEIANRLDDRFSLLTSGSRTALPRHQTLRAAIDWSYELLAEPERILFSRLAVFAGGFTLEAVESICGFGELKRSDILDLLGRLVDKSMVIVETDSVLNETRYRLLETIRQYALEKLVEVDEGSIIRDRHLEFYLDLAQKSEAQIFGVESVARFQRLEKELDNIRAAIEWSTSSGKAVAALEIVGSLVYFWFARGHLASEWNEHAQHALSRPEGRERTLARAKALNGIGFMYWADIYPTDKRSELEEALSIGREFGDRWNIATALRNLGLTENIQGNYEQAQKLLEESLAIWREMGAEGKNGSGWTLIFLGDGALSQAESEQARLYYEEAQEFLRGIGDVNFLAYLIRRLAQLAWREGNHEKALALCAESLSMNQEVGDMRGMVACLAGFAAIAASQGRFERAASMMSAVETQLSSTGIRLLYLDKIEYDRNLLLLRDQLDEKTLNKFWAKGKGMSLEETISFSLG